MEVDRIKEMKEKRDDFIFNHESKGAIQMKRIIVLVGGSGSGKTTIAVELEKVGFHRLVTMTTRPMREGEVNHVDYHFVSPQEFWEIDKVEENEYVGYWYGLSKSEVKCKMDSYDDLVIVMDVNGAVAMKKEYGDLVRVIFLTISPEEMEFRLRSRGGNEAHIQERIQNAYRNHEFDIPDVADMVINNQSIQATVKFILKFIKKEAY